MYQGGKHAAEPTRVDNKRERRRGAAGRAAALRRAPSDSDCSGETASLSADSGDRGPRPAAPPPRSGKTRSRRRGSEWEVLEGLKDGQRFEKRPDVFNGYLHKKRKWPLKGWHKRFFVVDAGILVYARSPADVARGRLHGSVDVGLSVLSAKARRRRIDIDADEFIYHLRAKTPEVFRTWLNILKAHRLYRQHLLTFGARESVPKIHAPADDLPATDTSSRTSYTSSETRTETSNVDPSNANSKPVVSPVPFEIESLNYNNKNQNSIYSWQQESLSKSDLIPLSLKQTVFDLKFDDTLYNHHRSLCSMQCVARRFVDNLKRKNSPDVSMNSTDAEKQMICTDLDLNSLKTTKPNIDSNTSRSKAIDSSIIKDISKGDNTLYNCDDIKNVLVDQKPSPFLNKAKIVTPTACFFFTRKKNRFDNSESLMKKSRKCTNLVRYKNLSDEPPMKMPLSKCMLLGKYQLKKSNTCDTERVNVRVVAGDTVRKINNETQSTIDSKENKSQQNSMASVDYDKITEKLMISILQNNSETENEDDVKAYIDQVIQDLYDIKLNQEMHPVKELFKSLLGYWLKNTTVAKFKKAMISDKSVNRQSNKCFTKDENLSSFIVGMASKETQCRQRSDVIVQYKLNKNLNVRPIAKVAKYEKKNPSAYHGPKRDTESFEKEQRIQELEKLLKNTVYVCETRGNNINKEKDIKITKTLIDNLEILNNKPYTINNPAEVPKLEISNSSTELPEIQDTINHLISETAIPPDVAKEFLGAYLDLLLEDSSKSITTSQSSDWSRHSKDIPACDVIAESVVKKVSRSVTTLENQNNKDAKMKTTTNMEKQVDPGQVYLKDILDKVTTIFSRVKRKQDSTWHKETPKVEKTLPNKVENTIKDELGTPVTKCFQKDFVYKTCDENSLVIDLSKYKLENISTFNDPAIKGLMSMTLQLKDKSQRFEENKRTYLNLYHQGIVFPDDDKTPIRSEVKKSDTWFSFIDPEDSVSNDLFSKRPLDPNKHVCPDFDAHKEIIDFKPYLSKSDATSKANHVLHESLNSIDKPNTIHYNAENDLPLDTKENEDQSCYIMSIKKGTLASKFQSRKNVSLKECNRVIFKSREGSPSKSSNKPELTVFENHAPRIIDEKFIILLLENLTLLSKTVPTLHKDINSLYLKLRKKHEKVVKNCSNIQGLSLLGKIYSEDLCPKDGDDECTQFEPQINSELYKTQKFMLNTATNTNLCKVEHKTVYANTVEKELTSTEVQTAEIEDILLDNHNQNETTVSIKQIPRVYENEIPKSCPTFDILSDTKVTKDKLNTSKDRMIITETETIDIESINQSTSNPRWFNKTTKDCGTSTIIKCVLDYAGTNTFRMAPARRIERESLKNKKRSPKVRQDLIKEISLLSPSFKVSTQSQTERQLICLRVDEHKEKDFDLCQLFMSKKYRLRESSSMRVCSNSDVEKSDDLKTLYRCSSDPSYTSGLLSPSTPPIRGPQAGFVSGTPGGRLAGWIIESGGPLETASRELGQAQLSVQRLQRLLDALELQQQVHHDTDVSLDGASPSVKKDRRKFGLRKKKSNSKCASVDLAPPHTDPSSSHSALSALTAPPSPGGGASSVPNSAASLPIACAAARPQSLPGAESLATAPAPGPASLTSLTPDHQLREDFTVLAKDLVASLKSIVSTMVCERGRLRAAMEAAETAAPAGAVVSALRTNLTSALQQNSELRTRLSRIHDTSDIAEILSVANSDAVTRQFRQSLSYSSSCVSASEFFDAEEHEEDDLKPEDVLGADEVGVIELDGESSSEAGSLSSEEGSASSDNSDGAMVSAEAVTLRHDGAGARPASCWTRRTRLPAPRPSPGGPSLWNLLYKNIGKDLSQISMPVTINEPLNMLQRLCEELEYSELLDSAAECKSAVERMALIAAFAVSAYAASAHRAASKPFNPLLAETYECVRDDRGFRFLAEQVSHHPPVSACHAESPRWCFWQEARLKTKFWGKSMEFQPTGRVHVRLNTTGDHYTWNKVTTCVHNLFGGQRWVDQYGDMHITCVGTDITCKLNFVKASSWSQTRHEVRGAVVQGGASGSRVRLAGRWSEALYAGEPPAARCLWRPGAMPPEHELYYGFTRFAMELNEMEPGMREVLPHSDTRFRPDQRALEEGDVDAAEQFKLELEQAQRERRRESPTHRPAWFRKTVEDGEETWVFSGEYWKAREAGFPDDAAPRIW